MNWFFRFANRKYAPLLVVAGLAVLIRALILPASSGVLWPDSLTYHQQAMAIFLSDNFADHEIYRTPGFPLFLSFFFNLGDSPFTGLMFVLAQRVLGVATIIFFYLTIRRAFGGEAALLSGMLFAIHDLFLYYETVVQTELLFMFFLGLIVFQFSNQLSRPTLPGFLILGILLGFLSLTRPIGQFLILFIAAITILHRPKLKRVIPLCLAMLLAFIVTCLPWMYVNKQTFGFFGLSHDTGVNAFHRVFDLDRMDPPADTKFRYLANRLAQDREKYPRNASYLRVFNELVGRRHNDLETDRDMLGIALETASLHPFGFARNTLDLWLRFFFESRESVRFCWAPRGRYLCVPTTIGRSRTGFINRPSFETTFWLNLTRDIFSVCSLPMAFICGLSILGVAIYLFRARPVDPLAVFFMVTIFYFSCVTAVFNQPEDRFRMPVDPMLFAFASFFVLWLRSEITERLRKRAKILAT